MLGSKYVHLCEKWPWIPTASTFVILLGCAGKHLVNVPMGTGQAEASNVLSFMGVIFGFVIGWVSLASDYNVYQPASTLAWKTFGGELEQAGARPDWYRGGHCVPVWRVGHGDGDGADLGELSYHILQPSFPALCDDTSGH
ncbi:hypothetical protein DFH08DRAFT_901427 [Mycena albidolilacea]|uniref:Uncharacterized protein n=1 Tax=Mycena albidolilacea TaxID=1033008 RepID=A0AAD7EA86_9AGAR|nr:hypothetical protein DFH08DRAFT_901427 [Mycena albidolilacea]